MPASPARHPRVERDAGMRFIEWLTSPAGRKAIEDFEVAGESPFFAATPSR